MLELQREVGGLSDPVSPKFVRDFQTSVVSQTVSNEFMDQVIEESLKVPARAWRDVMAGMLASPTKLDFGKVTAPPLIVWGDRETVFPDRADQDALTKAIPNATLKVYTGTGHCPNWEKPERFLRRIWKRSSKDKCQVPGAGCRVTGGRWRGSELANPPVARRAISQ